MKRTGKLAESVNRAYLSVKCPLQKKSKQTKKNKPTNQTNKQKKQQTGKQMSGMSFIINKDEYWI